MVECPRGNRPAIAYEESMIKNLVFDLGNVLLNWNPELYLIEKGYSRESRDVVLRDVFKSPEWLMLDNGDLTLEEAVERISLKSTLKKDQILSAFNLRLEILYPIGPNIILLPELKKQGFRLYYLSNFPGDIFDEVHVGNSFFGYFDGGIISAHVRASKPDPQIFIHLAERYDIRFSETLFVDDLIQNVITAEELGMFVIHLENRENLKALLEEILGIAISV